MKYKTFQDEEFKIVDVKQGNGNEAEAAVFAVETALGHVFTVRPRGSIEYRRYIYSNKQKFIGKSLTVRYQDKDEQTGICRFPVGIVRDYE